MIEEIGIVAAVKDQQIWVETQIKSTCGSCQANDNCGTGVIAKAFAPKTELLEFNWPSPVEVGQKVRLGIPEQHLLGASLLVYLVPMLVLLFSSVGAQWLLPQLGLISEVWVMLVAAFATGATFMGLRNLLHDDKGGRFQPRILGILPRESETIAVTLIPPGN